MFNRRFSERDHKRAQVINLYAHGAYVGYFTLPWTDSRFVKPREIMETAARVAKERPCRRLDDQPVTEVWDEIRFVWGIMEFACDRNGVPLQQAA